MDKEQSALLNFINLHAHKAHIDKNRRCVYVTKYNEQGIKLDIKLTKLDQDKIVQNYDVSNRLIQWVLNQLNTYDQNKEVIIGLEFDNGNLLTHVIRLAQDDN